MSQIEFTVEAIQRDARGVIVCGRCCRADFGLHDVFTAVRRTRFKRGDEPGQLERCEVDEVAEVSLEVVEIGFYGQSIPLLDPGYTAGLRFSGQGQERLLELKQSPLVVWSLVGEKRNAPAVQDQASG